MVYVWTGSAHALSIEPTQEDSLLAQVITRELERRHLASDSLFAERKPMVGQLILKAIDPSRSLLTQADILQADTDRLPEQIEQGRLSTVYQLYGLSLNRSEERLKYWLRVLNYGSGSIDLTNQESLRIRDEKTPWVDDFGALKDLWRKQLENQAIGLLLAERTEDEVFKALIRRYQSQKNRLEQTRPDDIFAGVINAYASAYDPHTSYLPPADSETFNINMSLSLQGIGAVLQSEDEFTKVVSLIPGGPAEMDGRLKPADRILSIAQGSQSFEDVVGWRLDEVVQKIRGPKGSQVRLEVQAGDDAPHREIVLIRDRVQLKEQSAKSEIIEAGANGEKIGIITIPTFYSDFAAKQAGDPNYRSTTRDVKRLLVNSPVRMFKESSWTYEITVAVPCRRHMSCSGSSSLVVQSSRFKVPAGVLTFVVTETQRYLGKVQWLFWSIASAPQQVKSSLVQCKTTDAGWLSGHKHLVKGLFRHFSQSTKVSLS